MNTSADAADQVVKMSLNSAEVALRVSGKGAGEMAKLLYKMLRDMKSESKKTKGQMRLNNLIKSGKKLDIYQVPDINLRKFCQEAKKYGVVYTVLKDRNKNDGLTEIMIKSEDKQKVDHIYETLDLAPTDVASVRPDTGKGLDEKKAPERSAPEKSREDKFLDELLSKPNPSKEEGHTKNPTQARTTKPSRSVPSSETKRKVPKDATREITKGKPSVRKELSDIKSEQEKQRKNDRTDKTPTKTNEHKHVQKKKKVKER